MKPLRFSPGTFLEVDDLQGGRKVVMVGKDGVTFWDALQTDVVTPLSVHPVMNPVSLGSMVAFLQSKGISQATLKVREVLRAQLDERSDDSLFVMRAAWALAAKGIKDGDAVDDLVLQDAIEAARKQERVAIGLHQVIEKFVGGQAA